MDLSEIQLYIFDLDGTLLDSMPVWNGLGAKYLFSQGVTPPPNLDRMLAPLPFSQSAAVLRSFGVKKTEPEILSDLLTLVRNAYEQWIPAKPGAYELLRHLSSYGAPIVLLTSSDASYLRPALSRTGLLPFFNELYTSASLGLTKTTPEIYLKLARQYHAAPEKTMVFEDADFAVAQAAKAGMKVVAVREEAFLYAEEIIKKQHGVM